MTPQQAQRITGRLTETTKMPGYSYALPAKRCLSGRLLRKMDNTVCSKCYAFKGRYPFGAVQAAMAKHFRAIRSPRWVEAMVTMIQTYAPMKSRYFRWHDSGDLQSVAHFESIVEIARRLPAFRFWLPTREYGLVQEWLDGGNAVPVNLVVRLTSTFVDGGPFKFHDWPVAVVYDKEAPPDGAHRCPAFQQFNHCDDCRACWDPSVRTVAYPLH
jgi:hypothetical protein